MSEVLVIRLGSIAGQMIPWLVWSDAEQEIIASGEISGAEQLDTLSSHAQHREVSILVPACDLTLKTVALPGKFNRQIISALPYMLEEELANDVGGLFFAIGDKTTLDGKVAVEVAIVDRTLFETWQQWLADAQINTQVMLPDALCLPLHGQGISGIEFNGQWLVRSGTFACQSIDSGWFDDYLALAASGSTKKQEQQESDEKLGFNSYSPFDSDIAGLEVLAQAPELPLKLLWQHRPDNGFNLLQGEYAQSSQGSKAWSIWRPAAIAATVAVVLQLGLWGSTAWQLGNALDGEKAVFIEQYKKAFPSEKRVRSALVERQLKSKLKAVEGSQGGDSGFLAMLDQVAPVFQQTEGFSPNSIKFDSKRNELRVQATGDGFASFEKFKSAVENLGYEVQQGSLNNDGDKVVGAITLKRAG